MSLTEYENKRSFDKTPEPKGGKPTGKKLTFVIQKHDASHLHYDFRLELRGILKSWAVPKGPSMDPSERRLAMLVEDHPWNYRDFEGIIPSGYGKGTVIVWDGGNYYTPAIKQTDKEAQEHAITSQFWKGDIVFSLRGHKLKGKFRLKRERAKGDNAWYLIKEKDKYANQNDVTQKDKSILSGKTIEEVGANPAHEWQSKKPAGKMRTAKAADGEINLILRPAIKSKMPSSASPMLCTLIKKPFNDPAWVYEVKWDGYRIIAFIKKGKVILKSRGNQNYTHKYQEIASACEDFRYDAVIDGEVVVLDANGNPDFSGLQNYRPGDSIAFYVFDCIWCDGYDVTNLPLVDRKSLLQKIIPENELIKFSESFADGLGLFENVKKLGIEGIVAKRKDSIYTQGKRDNAWYKAKLSVRQEYVIGGWTESDNGRLFRSLIFGNYVDDRFTYVHHSGGGFTEKQAKELYQKLKKLEIDKSPFVNKVDIKARKHWTRPELVAEFDKSGQTTKSGHIRHPAIFIGLRDDKKASDVVEEVPKSVSVEKTGSSAKGSNGSKPGNIDSKETGSWESLEKRRVTSENELIIEGHKIDLLNIERELWPGITKAELIQYYISVSDYLLPHLKDRPVGLNICLNQAAQGGFFIRGMEGKAPSWTTIFTTDRKHKMKGKSDVIEWLVCNNKATLVYAVNLESIDIHPWTSRIESPNNPDYIVIDLDPSDDDFKKVIDTALTAKKLFDNYGLSSFVKTSGKSGLHLLIPCTGIAFGDSRKIATHICQFIHEQLPEITTTNVSVNSRGKRLYIDPNQNDYADRVAAAYCVRAYHSPAVSTPLDWKEVNHKLNPADYTIKTIGKRLEKKGDLFKNILNEKLRLTNAKILKKLI